MGDTSREATATDVSALRKENGRLKPVGAELVLETRLLMMTAHLQERAAALAAFGWTGRDAEWLALVCLHSGVFLRQQHLDFIGRTNPALANRFVRRCGTAAVEQPWNRSRLRLCRITSRSLYRALGIEHVRHRRAAAPEVVLRAAAGARLRA